MKVLTSKNSIFWLLVIFAAVYLLWDIGTGSLTNWDEAVYANVSKGIFKTGKWLNLSLNGRPWFEKPPLYMWFTALFYNLFGTNEFSVRITSALFGLGAVLLLYKFIHDEIGRDTALFGSLILLGLPHFVHFAKMGMMDVPLACLNLLIIYLFWIGREKAVYLFFSAFLVGIAYLMKGFASFLPVFIIVLYCILSAETKNLFKKEFLIGLAVSLLVILSWHYFQFLHSGEKALKEYFQYHVFQRATQNIEGHNGGFNFYQKALFNKNKPWSVIMFLSVIPLFWQAFKKKDKLLLLLSSWIVVTYVTFSLLATKLHWYIMPIYPAFAFSSALLLDKFLKGKAIKIALIVVLISLAIQAKTSWAFKLDFSPDYKDVSIFAKKLYDNGNDVYIIGATDTALFYCGDFAKLFDRNVYKGLMGKQMKNILCIITAANLGEAVKSYNFEFTPLLKKNEVSLFRLKFS